MVQRKKSFVAGLFAVALSGCASSLDDVQQAGQGVRSSDAAADADAAVVQTESTSALLARGARVRMPTRQEWQAFREGSRRAVTPSGTTTLAASSLVPRVPHAKPANPYVCADMREFNVLRMKFVEGTAIRLDANGLFFAEVPANLTQTMLDELAAINARADFQRMVTFTQSVGELTVYKEDAEKNTGEEYPDLTLWFDVLVGAGAVIVNENPTACAVTADAINWLNSLSIIEVAAPTPANDPPPYIPPTSPGVDLATPSAVFDPPHLMAFNPIGGTFGVNSPEFSYRLQIEHDPHWQGNQQRVVDVEYNWLWHEKLGEVYRIPGGMLGGFHDHATAVMSTTFGTHRSGLVETAQRYGTRGLAPRAAGRAFSAATSAPFGVNAVGAAILRAHREIWQEDTILVEQQRCVGDDWDDFDCSTGLYTAAEQEDSVYDAIRTATALGRVVVEPTGNGGTAPNNIDSWIGYRANSGAIVVAANSGAQNAQTPLPATGFGARVDMNAWGDFVQTAASPGYLGMDLEFPAPPANQNYIGRFNGTSSASAIIAGVITQLTSTYTGSFHHSMSLRPELVAPTLRSLVQSGAAFQLTSMGLNYGYQPDVERTATEFVLATRIQPDGPLVAQPHEQWISLGIGAGILHLSWAGRPGHYAWYTWNTGSPGVTATEFSIGTPDGPLDAGYNADRSFTIEAWVQVPSASAAWQTIIAKENPRNYGVWVAPTGHPDVGRVHFSYQPDGSATLCPSFSSSRIDDNQVHHVAVRFDRRASAGVTIPIVTFYVDGVHNGSSAGCAAVGPAASGAAGEDVVQIGANMTPGSYVGNVRLYHYLETSAMIEAHADEP